MEDFFYAGGLRGLLARLDRSAQSRLRSPSTARRLGENIDGAEGLQRRRHPAARHAAAGRTAASPSCAATSAPDGAVIKPAAAEPHLLKHSGPAIVFRDYNDMAARIDDPDLPVTEDSVLVLQNAGPLGGPGMPEWGQLPIPKKLLKQGVRDMVRISDARMSGTSYGACVLHVAPESCVGGPLALVQTGDIIDPRRRGAAARRCNVSDAELAKRKARLGQARADLPARLRRHAHAPRHPGRQGLRLRLPARRQAGAGAGNSLRSTAYLAGDRAGQVVIYSAATNPPTKAGRQF